MVLFLIGINFLVFGITGCSKVVLLQVEIILPLNHFISLRNAGVDFSLISFVIITITVSFDLLLLRSEIRSMIGDQIDDLLCCFRVVLRRLAIDLILLLINNIVLSVARFRQ